ncbi:MAG: methionine--tRNA ligase [Bacteroidota bacterium]
MSRHLVTAALPYANGPVHIGHLAGAYLPADIYVRYLRAIGEETVFICGSDEHGVPITLRARKEGITPQQAVDKYHGIIKKSFADFGISFDIYHRTSDTVHHRTASDFFRTLYDKGEFLVESTEQYYDEEAGIFLADRYITGTCPNCKQAGAYGDQCEKCGKSLSPRELIEPHSQLSGKAPVLRETKHWYLPLDRYQKEWLQTWLLEKKDKWKSNVFGQCKSWLDQGLQPRAVTRDLDWGVPVPVEGANGKVLYVWFDAPIGYISATKAFFEQRNDPAGWERFWKNEETKLVHFIGKDNIVLHCIIFPAMLKAHGGFILPEQVPANEFLNLEGDKISTSRNWAVWLHEFLIDFPGKEDVLRYVLCSTAPETKDNDFTWKDFQARNNNELVAILGNFVNRTLVLTQKYYEGKVPGRGPIEPIDRQYLDLLTQAPDKIGTAIRNFRFRDALTELMDVARAGNKYLADTEPWKLQATDPERVKTILSVSLELTARLTSMMSPFLPFTSEKLTKMLGIQSPAWNRPIDQIVMTEGHVIGEPSLLFEKIEDPAIQSQADRLQSIKAANEATNAQNTSSIKPMKSPTTFDDFQKMDIRIGTILAAERVPKTDKLLKLTIDTGIDQRTVVSGIATYFEPEKIIGLQVTLLANLEPRKIKGIESQGMILLAEDTDGKLVFVSPTEKVGSGSTVN